MNNPDVGIALVTHNSMPFLRETLDSIEPQLVDVSDIYVVDDHSDDGTTGVLETWVRHARSRGLTAQVHPSTSSARDPRTRTAQNFTHAVRALRSMDLIALADHDDRWLPDRLTCQVSAMVEHPDALLLAGNGTLMGQEGTLFDAFEVPDDLNSWECGHIARHVIRHSVATGSASMIRSDLLQHPDATPPSGWLHDRWWSLLAASRCGLLIDRRPVIEYRISTEQQVGVDRGRQSTRGLSRLGFAGVGDIRKVKELVALRHNASGAARPAFAPTSVIRSLTS